MAPKWKIIQSEYGQDLKLFRPRFDLMLNPRNQKSEKMIILESPDAANVVAITEDDHLLFVHQYRFGIQQYTLEIPGGIVDPGETPDIAAQRELLEETGYTSSNWSYLGKIGSNPVFMNSYIHHWLAKNVSFSDGVNLDDGEDIQLELLPIEEVKRKLESGFFIHPHTSNALLLFFANHYKTFL